MIDLELKKRDHLKKIFGNSIDGFISPTQIFYILRKKILDSQYDWPLFVIVMVFENTQYCRLLNLKNII